MGHDGAPSKTPDATTCPECGWRRGDRLAKPQGSARWVFWIPALCLGLGLAALLAWCAAGTERLAVGSGFPSGYILEPGFTSEDVRRIAEGEAPEDAEFLAREIAEVAAKQFGRAPGEHVLEFGFLKPYEQSRHESRSFGWPSSWLSTSRKYRYTDAVKREGVLAPLTPFPGLPPKPNPEWTFRAGVVTHSPTPAPTDDAAVHRWINLVGLTIIPGALIAGWWIGVIGWILVRKVRRRPGEPRGRRRAGVVCAAIALLVVLQLGRRPEVSARLFAPPSTGSVVMPDGSNLPVGDWLGRLEPSADQVLAQAITPELGKDFARTIWDAHVLNPAGGATGYLALSVTPEAVLTNSETLRVPNAFPFVTLDQNQYIRRPDFGTPEAIGWPGGKSVERQGSLVSVYVGSKDPDLPIHSLHAYLDRVVLALVGLWVLWTVPRRLCLLIWRIIVSWAARFMCPRCGYELASTTSDTRPDPS